MFFHCLTNRVSEVPPIREHCSDSNYSLKISTSVSPSSQPTDRNKRYTSLHELIGGVFTKPIGLMKLHLQNIMCMLLKEMCTDCAMYVHLYICHRAIDLLNPIAIMWGSIDAGYVILT